MSTPTFLLFLWFVVGLVWMIVAVVTRNKERNARMMDFSLATQLDAALLLLTAMFWPLWVIVLVFRKDPAERRAEKAQGPDGSGG